MSLFSQQLLDIHPELIVDLFAGGGGASTGIEMALGRQVDVAINHDAPAVELHKANHPQTHHYHCDVFEVDPVKVTNGRAVAALWASPDCTYHSKARGGKPIRHGNRKRRSLAWVICRWAALTKVRVIMGENVEEFVNWGPLVAKRDEATGRVVKVDGTVAEPGERVPVQEQQLVPCGRRTGETYRRFIRQLRDLGYEVEWKELRACDFGAPTIRKRWFFIARCDGKPIVWPTPTHGAPGSEGVKRRKLKPFRTAAECVDWSIPMLSIFATREEAREWGKLNGQAAPVRPLAEATMRRVARGVRRYVIDNPKPYIVGVGGRQGQSGERPLDKPFQTITAKGDSALVAPMVVPVQNASSASSNPADVPLRTITAHPKGGGFALAGATMVHVGNGEREGQAPRALDIEAPLNTVVGGSAKFGLVAAFMAKHFTGVDGAPLDVPAPTVTTVDHNSLVAAHLSSYHAEKSDTDTRAASVDAPVPTLDTSNRHGVVAAFLAKYYGTADGDEVSNPAPTITPKDRFGLVTVMVAGVMHAIADIAMRMLQPRELYNAQGFYPSYIIDRGADGRLLTKTEQVRMVGNSVCPQLSEALARANVPELIVRTLNRKRA